MALITLDFETYFDKQYSLKRMTTLDYVTDERFKIHGVGIKIDDTPCGYYHEPERIKEEILKLFPPGNDQELVCQNTRFEALVLDIHFGVRPGHYRDTMLMARGCNPHGQSSLKAIAEMLWPDDPKMRKGEELQGFEGVVNIPDDQQHIIAGYCIQDCELTYAAYQEFKKFYPPLELEIIHITLKMWAEPSFVLDEARVAKHLKNEEDHTQLLVEKSGVSRDVLSSNPKFTTFLEALGIEIPTKISPNTGKSTPALGKNDVAFQSLQRQHPELSHIWQARKAVKSTIEASRSKRLLNNAARDKGRIRVPLNYYGAHTGRFSGGEKINLQNLTRGGELRASLTAPPGYKVYVCDLSQIEARKLAWFAGETELVEDFRSGVDIYSNFASGIYGRKIDRKRKELDADGNYFKPDELEGHVGKVCILGLGYQMGPPRFQDTLAQGALGGPPIFFDLGQCKHIVYDLYRGKYRGIVNTWDRAGRAIMDMSMGESYQWGCVTVDHNRIILPNGLALNYPGLKAIDHPDARNEFQYHNGKKWTKLYGGLLTENIIQALAGITIKEQMVKVSTFFQDGITALQVHDEIIFVMPEDHADERMANIIRLMSQAPAWCSDLPVACEGDYGDDYSVK